jgi:hypothetical protein
MNVIDRDKRPVCRLNGTWDVALMNGEVVVVTSNYRLNIFGFLAAEELRSRDPSGDGSTGNYGRSLSPTLPQHVRGAGGLGTAGGVLRVIYVSTFALAPRLYRPTKHRLCF